MLLVLSLVMAEVAALLAAIRSESVMVMMSPIRKALRSP